MTKMTKSISLILAFVIFICSFSVLLSIPTYAASLSFPTINSKNYIETKAEVGMPVYQDKNLKNRGTYSPWKKYNSVIDQWDTVKILAINGNKSLLVEFPTTTGWKKGYVSFSNFFNYSPSEKITAKESVSVSIAPYGAKYGTIVNNDTVYRVGESNGHILVLYSARYGNRGFKLGYILESDYKKIQKQDSEDQIVSSTESTAYKTLTQMKNGTAYNGVYKEKTVYAGPYKNEQCKGFAKSVFEKLYGYNIGSTCSKSDGINYKLEINTSKTTYLGSVTQMETNTKSQNNIKNLFLRASAGDFVQMRRQHGGSHSAIVYSVTKKGVTFFEANIDGKNGIVLKTYTWYDLCKSNSAMSVYRDK